MVIERKTRNQVDAFQWTGDTNLIPDWAILDSRIEIFKPDEFSIYKEDGHANVSLCIKTINAGFPQIGQWIIKNIKDKLSIFDEEAFHKAYEFIPDAEIEKLNKNKDPRTMSREVLLYDHSILHYRYAKVLSGLKYENWSKEDFVNYHALMVDAMREKDIPHFPYNDELDKDSKKFETVKKYMKLNPSGDKMGDKIFLEEVLPSFESYKMRHNYITMVGGMAIHGSTENDIDILINDNPDAPQEFRHILEWKMLRGQNSKHWDRFQFHYNRFYGPFTDFIPLYDMVIERVNPTNKIIRMSENQKGDHVYSAALDFYNYEDSVIELSMDKDGRYVTKAASPAIDPQAKKEADMSLKEDRIKMFRYFYPLKTSLSPFAAYRLAEVYNIEGLIEHLNKLAKRYNITGIPKVLIQKKYDGLRGMVFKKGDKVKIMSDDGADITGRFPKIVAEARKFDKDYIFDTEIELWENGKHQPREFVAGYVHEKGKPDDSNIVVNVFDLLYVDDKDLHKIQQDKRFEMLQEFKFPQSTIAEPEKLGTFNLAETVITDDPKKLEKEATRYAEAPASEGAMIKTAISLYPLNGVTSDVIKFKKYAEVHTIVSAVNKTKVPTVWNYDIAVGVPAGIKISPKSLVVIGNKKYSSVGKSFNTDIKAKPGDILTISFHTMNVYRDPATGEFRITLFEPRVREKRLDRETPDFITDAIRIGKDAGLLEEKSEGELEKDLKRIEKDVITSKAIDPFMISPEEDMKYQYVVQNHHRGKSFHMDLRVESLNKESLIGWTIFNQIVGSVKEEVTTLEQAKSIAVNGKYSKIDFGTGEWAQRKKKGTTELVNAELGASRKAIEPVEWLKSETFWEHVKDSLLGSGIEFKDSSWVNKLSEPLKERLLNEFVQKIHGVIPAGEVGATKNYPGVFYIVDKGEAEYLTQKPWFHEYYFNTRKSKGGLKGRYLFRQLKTAEIGKDIEDELKKAEVYEKIVLPAAETEFREEAAWFFIKPLDQTPYVISDRAVKQKWIPPHNISALPEYIRKQIPGKFQYWKLEEEKDRMEIRDELVKAMKEDEVKVVVEKMIIENISQTDARFVLQYQTWRTKGEKPVRAGPTQTSYHIRIDTGKNTIMSWTSDHNMLDISELAGYYNKESKAAMELEGNIEPGTKFNPFPETTSVIEKLDKGKAVVMSDQPTFKKIEFKGDKLKGVWTIQEKNTVWLIKRSQAAPKV